MASPDTYKRRIRDELNAQALTDKELAAAVARTTLPRSISTPDLEAGFRMGFEEALRNPVAGEEVAAASDRTPVKEAYMAEFLARVATKVGQEEG